MGCFTYLGVENGVSYALEEKVDEETNKERQNHLMEMQQKISARKLRRFRGARATALVEGPSKETPLIWEARLECMAPEIDGKLYLNDIEVPQTLLSAQGADKQPLAGARDKKPLPYQTPRPRDLLTVEITD